MKRYWKDIAVNVQLKNSGQNHGYLNATFIDPESGKVLAFLAGMGHVVAPIDLSNWELESVQLSTPNALVVPSELVRLEQFGLRHCMLNLKPVHAKDGKHLGRVTDYQLDLTDDQLLQIEVTKGLLFTNKRLVSWEHIDHITESAIHLKTDGGTKQSSRSFMGWLRKLLFKDSKKQTAAAPV